MVFDPPGSYQVQRAKDQPGISWAFSDQIAEQKAQISALQTELESFRSTSQETENAQANGISHAGKL